MLLLVIDAELDQRRGFRAHAAGEEQRERLVHMRAIVAHGLGRRAREQPTFAARLPRSHALIIGVEAIFEALVEHAVAGEEALQHEGLEEPSGMGEVPFGRARIVIGLHDLVLVAQGPGELARQRPGAEQAVPEAAAPERCR